LSSLPLFVCSCHWLLQNGCHLRQLDVQNTFLHDILEEEVYMCQPPRFGDSAQPQHLCRMVKTLVKALYCLKHAPPTWHALLGATLRAHGFTPASADRSLFMLHRPEVTMYMLVYVVDIILVSSSTTAASHFVKDSSSKFAVKDLGPPFTSSWVLRFTLYPRDWFSHRRSIYVLDLLRQVRMLCVTLCLLLFLLLISLVPLMAIISLLRMSLSISVLLKARSTSFSLARASCLL
jgi:hypothetical protein